MVVSNIRMPESDWLQVKATASEMGMSINEYLNRLSMDFTKMKFFGYKESIRRKIQVRKKNIYKELIEFAKTPYKSKPMNLSADDKIIYGI